MVHEIQITLPEQGEKIKVNVPEPDKDTFDELKEQYGFASDSEAARCFLKLGMMSAVDNDPRHSTTSQSGEEFLPVTIRELIPEGVENAVEIDEFCEQILRDKMMDIAIDDPEIKRDGLKLYR
jgi:hypothetical protein